MAWGNSWDGLSGSGPPFTVQFARGAAGATAAGGAEPASGRAGAGRGGGLTGAAETGCGEGRGAGVLSGSQGGMSKHPAWYGNVRAHPDVEVEIGAEVRKMHARTASAEEKAAVWPKLVAMYPSYATYQARTDRDIPVVILEPR